MLAIGWCMIFELNWMRTCVIVCTHLVWAWFNMFEASTFGFCSLAKKTSPQRQYMSIAWDFCNWDLVLCLAVSNCCVISTCMRRLPDQCKSQDHQSHSIESDCKWSIFVSVFRMWYTAWWPIWKCLNVIHLTELETENAELPSSHNLCKWGRTLTIHKPSWTKHNLHKWNYRGLENTPELKQKKTGF
jgi:hypothetical protein